MKGVTCGCSPRGFSGGITIHGGLEQRLQPVEDIRQTQHRAELERIIKLAFEKEGTPFLQRRHVAQQRVRLNDDAFARVFRVLGADGRKARLDISDQGGGQRLARPLKERDQGGSNGTRRRSPASVPHTKQTVNRFSSDNMHMCPVDAEQ